MGYPAYMGDKTIQKTGDSGKPILGESAQHVVFDSRAENRSLAAAMAAQATRTIDLFSPDLEFTVYDSREFIDAITRLAIRSRFSRVRILVQDSGTLVRQGHRLVEVARRFPSSVEMHKPSPEHRDMGGAFMIVDGRGYIYKKVSSRYEGEANFTDPLRARDLKKWFDELWEASQPDVELRRLYI
jgi:hypothetical protein